MQNRTGKLWLPFHYYTCICICICHYIVCLDGRRSPPLEEISFALAHSCPLQGVCGILPIAAESRLVRRKIRNVVFRGLEFVYFFGVGHLVDTRGVLLFIRLKLDLLMLLLVLVLVLVLVLARAVVSVKIATAISCIIVKI